MVATMLRSHDQLNSSHFIIVNPLSITEQSQLNITNKKLHSAPLHVWIELLSELNRYEISATSKSKAHLIPGDINKIIFVTYNAVVIDSKGIKSV